MREILTGIFFFFVLSVSAQKISSKTIEKGFLMSYGYSSAENKLQEGNYNVMMFQGRFSMDFFHRRDTIQKNKFFYKFLIGNEPQFNLVWVGSQQAWEFGINNTLQPTFKLTERLYPYFIGSTGLHFFSATLAKQRRGFIFSNSVGVGTYYRISQRFALNGQFRIRHMSNLNTRMPNDGINTQHFHFGISWCVP